MSADDFQSKYASVMESMLKGAVAETTKLFETMVDELKAEISRIKKENEDLKTRCSRFESARGQATVYTRGSECPQRRSDISETRDTAVQCDLVPFRMMLVEQCQPLTQSLQNQTQRGYEMESALREHDYETHGEESSQMVILVKQEHEEVESSVVYGQVLSDKADSPWASTCGIENEGHFMNKMSSTRERPLPQRREETQVLPELPSSGTYSGLHGAQNQSSELEPSFVISVAAIKDDMEEESEVTQEMSETGTQREHMTTGKHLLVIEQLDKEQPSVVPQQCQREGSVNDQSDVALKQYIDVYSPQEQMAQPTQLSRGEACDELKNGVAEVEASSQPDLAIRRRRGRPPKKAKPLQQPVKEILQSPSSDTPTVQEVKRSPRLRIKEVKVSYAVHAGNITSSESPQAFPVQPKEPPSIITRSSQERENIALADVESSKVASVAASGASLSRRCSSEKGKASESQQLTMDREGGAIQAPSTEVSPAVETGNTPPAESSQAPSAQPRERQTSVTLQDAILLVEAMNRSMVENTSSSAQKTTQATIQKLGALPQITDATTNNEAQAHIEFLQPTSVSKTTTSSKSPSTVGTQTSMQSLQQNHPLTTSLAPSRRGNSLTHKIIVVPRAVSSLRPQKLEARSPIHLSTVVSWKRPLQTNVLTTRRESAAPVKVSSSEEPSVSVGTHTTLSKVDITSSQKRDNTPNTLVSPKQTASVSETLTAHPETCSSLDMSVGQAPTIISPVVGLTAEQNLSAVVKLTRLPFSVSTRESIVNARQQINGPSDSQSVLKDGTTGEKTSSVFTPIQPSETFLLSEELNNNQQKASLTEKCTTLEQLPNAGYVQPTKVSQPVFEKSAIAVNKIQPPAISDTAGETTSNLGEEIPNDQPTEERPAALIHLTSITSKDTADPHLQMTKAHFLAQLAVSPVAQDPKKVSSNDGVDDKASCAEANTSDKKGLQKNSLIAQLRSHIKTYLQTKRTETNPELCTEAETHTANLKKPRLESDHPIDKNTTNELVSLSPKNPLRITNDPPTIGSRRSALCKDGVKPKRTVDESSSVSSRRGKASESTPVRRSNPTKEFATPEKSRNTFVRHRRSRTTGDSTSPKSTKTTSVRPQRISSSRGGATPAKTTSLSPRTPHSGKNSTSPKMSTSDSPSVIHRRRTLTKDGFSTKQIKTGPDAFSLRRCSTTTDGASPENIKSETDSPRVRLPTLAKDGVSLRKTRDCTSLRVVNAKKLAKAAKAKTIAKIKNSKQSKAQNESSSENRARKCAATAVWTPPRNPASKTSSGGVMSSAQLPVKKEVRSLDCTVVYPPSVTLHPIPVKAPPVVSPLQPLSVIGRRLLRNQCGECGCVFSSSVALESHVSLHTGQQPFSCKLCGKRFSDSKGLKRHDRVHRNGRIHICQKCGKGFAYRFCLTKHIQVVHSKIKPFVCQVCDKGYFTKRDVEAHIRIHTGEKPFHCNLCEKKFARRVELNVHLRWHNGEKRHWCPYCGKGFLDFNNLKRHKYIHTGEKPHSCPHCPKNFTQSGHLKKHVKNVHKIQ